MEKVVSIIGAGNVGEHTASLIVLRELANVRLFDLPRKTQEGVLEPVKGKALDLQQMAGALNLDVKVEGYTVSPEGEGYEALEGSDLVVITAGFPRRPGMSREDLLEKNIQIIKVLAKRVSQFCPESVVIVVSNPVDVLTYAFLKLSGFDRRKVIGMAGILDSARFKTFLAQKLRVSVSNINSYVIGGHGDEMVPLTSSSRVGGLPLKELIDEGELRGIVERTRKGGGEIVSLMGTSAYHAPGASVYKMVEAILKDKGAIYPCSVYLEGQEGEYYGVKGFCVGVPVKLGREGILEVLKAPMDEEEREMWKKSVESVRRSVELAKKFLS